MPFQFKEDPENMPAFKRYRPEPRKRVPEMPEIPIKLKEKKPPPPPDTDFDKPIACIYGGLMSVYILKIEYEIDDYVRAAHVMSDEGYPRRKFDYVKCKIRYDSERAYFNLNKERWYLDEAMKIS